MNSYEERQEARRERLEAAADRAEAASNAAYKRADMRESASGIPFGQPILVGHHSEGRHRAAIKRADSAMRSSISEGKRAAELRDKAAAVGSAGISSDDPEAIDKLGEKLAKLIRAQDMMKAANKIVRAFWGAGVRDENSGPMWDKYLAKMIEAGFAASGAAAAIKPDCMKRIGFASYQLSNNNAEIARCKLRIAKLERAALALPVKREIKGVQLIEDPEANRLRLIFNGKPSEEIRAALKSGGFRWAPSEGAWQRHLSNGARYAAQQVLAGI